VLEIVVRPPITTLEKDTEATGPIEQLDWDLVESVFARAVSEPVVSVIEEDELGQDLHSSSNQASMSASETISDTTTSNKTEQSTGLNKKLGMDFENVGGLDSQLDDIARRVLASRANPEAARRLGVSHVRGILLSGPPGCGEHISLE
jgi:ATP-dependent 26S proteasome regulatory subunit